MTITIDSPQSVLDAAVQANGGQCLICTKKPAKYCGLSCTRGKQTKKYGVWCRECHTYRALYCSRACALQGR